MFYGIYADVPDETLDAFVHARELGRLVTVGADDQLKVETRSSEEPALLE